MKIKIPIKIIELEPGNYHCIVESTFADGCIGNWIIDTGASKSVFDKNRKDDISKIDEHSEVIHSAGMNENPLEAEFAVLKPFKFLKHKILDFKVALLDLNHINDLYQTSTNVKICGLLGGDFLVKYNAVIDYRKRLITLYF